MNVDQYGQIYFKNKMVKFVIDKTVQFETIFYSLDSLCGDASVHFKLNFILLFFSFFFFFFGGGGVGLGWSGWM